MAIHRLCFAFALLPASAALFQSSAAAQDVSACGDIRLQAEARCEVVPPSVECEAECTPITVEAACAAELHATCDGMCEGELSASCSAECLVDCQAECTIDPGAFDCRGECRADCQGACAARCDARPNDASCMASCQGSCGAECDGMCNVVPPSADCDAKCEASCEGSCQAQADLDCQIDCQAEGFAACEARVEGGCEAACQGEQGALFCDGQYVDPRDSVDACVAALRAELDIEVTGYAESQGECSGGRCSGSVSAGGDSTCSVGRPGTGGPGAGGLMSGLGKPAWWEAALGAGALLLTRRLRRSSRQRRSKRRWLGLVTLVAILGCNSSTPAYAEEASSAGGESDGSDQKLSEARRQDLLVGYDLLATTLADESKLDTLEFVKKLTFDRPNDAISKLMDRLSDASEKRSDQLEELRKLSPQVAGEPEKRSPVGKAINEIAKESGKSDLMSRDGGFDVRFVLVQAQATRMVAAIAKALARFDPEPKRKKWLHEVARDYEGYRGELIKYLGGKPAE